MLVFGLDTSTLILSAALVRREGAEVEVLAEREQGPEGSHSERLPRLVNEMLAQAGASLSDLGGLAVGLGPGSFTGLRIGLATLKGLSYALKIPLAGASSLAALARAEARRAGAEGELIPALDARKGEVYAGFYEVHGASVRLTAPEEALAPEALAARLAGKSARLFGPGAVAYRDRLAGIAGITFCEGPRAPAGWAVAALATIPDAYAQAAAFSLEPHYIRASEAEAKALKAAAALAKPQPV